MFEESLRSFSFGSQNCVFSPHGGQLIEWSSEGTPILFSNVEHAIREVGKPYRGGAPWCFPYFSNGKLIDGVPRQPSHGSARISLWRVTEPSVTEDSLMWGAHYTAEGGLTLETEYHLSERRLRIAWCVQSDNPHETPFQLALHTYFSLPRSPDHSIPPLLLKGVGVPYLDNLEALQRFEGLSPHYTLDPPVDRIYLEPQNVLLTDMGAYSLEISQEGFSNVIVWNPGVEHTLKDLGEPDFLCIESGIVTPAAFAHRGRPWNGSVTYRVQPR